MSGGLTEIYLDADVDMNYFSIFSIASVFYCCFMYDKDRNKMYNPCNYLQNNKEYT